MLFHEKIGLVLKELGVSRTELARASGLDASLISRFYNGERIPSRFSPQLDKLSMGVAALALKQKSQNKICALCGAPECGEVSAISDAVNAWINMPDSSLRPQRAHKLQRPLVSTQHHGEGAFAEKLDALIRAAEVTNTSLARHLNVDASLISRFRSGVRVPGANKRLVANICTFFSLRDYTSRQRRALFGILRMEPTEDREALLDALRSYLQAGSANTDCVYVDDLLETLDSMRPALVNLAPVQTDDPVTLHSGVMDIYQGNAGLRRAAARLIESICADGNVRELRMFSDLDIQWVLEDEAFLNAWPEQLKRIMDQGTRITFIISMDASLHRLLLTIERWIPLFMTGKLNLYLLPRPAMRRFDCTLLLADKLAAVQSFCVTNMAPFASYLYTHNEELIENLHKQLDALCEFGCVSAQMFSEEMQTQYQRFLSAFERAPGDTDVVLHSLSAYTISPSLMERMLKRTGVPEETRERILTYHQLAVKRATKNLSLYSISDYICLADPAALSEGRVQVELPWLDGSARVAYTPAEYAEHIRTTIELLRTYPGYSIYLLPQVPFHNIKLMVRQGTGALIRKLDKPCIAMATAQPALVNALSNYIDILKLRSIRVHPDRGRGLKMMLQYLQIAEQAEG